MESKEVATFYASPQKQGDYFKFQIPIELIRAKIIDPDSTYEVILKEVGK
ncbi:MAG: hypothetical protein [Lokiarchaeia virus VerdaV1]|uniref:Uncharacterized protein n=1 Tax=Lokiarchaeia virus VerdaV1 TaxID=3070170 RepID=A0AA35GAG7_9CAUD|nr:MAG: hypothetical protein QIT41_gp24 [Lokiarchaeia virus VerdaV1]BDI54873.1 MAG: hypothetical protein [Lokiarchaeia virus VerdaV1]